MFRGAGQGRVRRLIIAELFRRQQHEHVAFALAAVPVAGVKRAFASYHQRAVAFDFLAVKEVGWRQLLAVVPMKFDWAVPLTGRELDFEQAPKRWAFFSAGA